MKKIKYLLLPAIFFLSIILLSNSDINILQGEEKKVEAIKTNYYDLPADQKIILKSMLDTSDLNTLSEKQLQLMERYFTDNVLHQFSKWSNHVNITSNYFWSIYHALPEFVDKSERHQGYYENQCDLNRADRLLAYAIYRIDRSPENLKRLFNFARPIIKEAITSQSSSYKRIRNKINILLGTYSMMIQIDNYREKMLNVSSKADMINGRTESDKDFSNYRHSAYGFTSYDLAELICFELGISRHGNYYGSTEWSFWMRRIREGNMEEVHSILVEISEMYRD
jgi:hypothetical protein